MSPGATDQQIPGPLLLRAASASLAVLRNNKDVSPVVKLQLRQAAHDLREAAEDASRRQSVERAAEGLRSSLEMIQNRMTIESDEKLLPGIASVLGYLTQFLGGPPAAIAERLPSRPTTTPLPGAVAPAPSTMPPAPTSPAGFSNSVADAHASWAVPVGARPVAATVVLPGMGPETPAPSRKDALPSTAGLGTAPPPATIAAAAVTSPPTSTQPAHVPDLARRLEPAPRIAISPDSLSPTLALQLVRIERQYVAREGCLDNPNSTFRDLQGIERRIRKREATARELLRAETGAADPEGKSVLSNVGAWWFGGQTGQLVAGNPVLATTVAQVAAGPVEEQRIAIDVVRMNPSHASTTDVWGALRGPVLMPLRARCLPLLFEHNLPDGEALVRMLGEPAMAMAAAATLAWCRIEDGSRRLLETALACPWPELSNALLLASVAQGDREPISEVRIRLATGSDSPWLVDALAVAGDEADAGLLCDVAASSEVPAEYALWAIAHLGASSMLGRMKDLEARLEPMLVTRAIELVSGSFDLTTLPAGRYVDGEPWSVAAVARRLAAPEELPLPILRWSALDLSVRMGAPAPCIYDIGASTEQQQVAGHAFAACYAASLEPGRGGWYYFGRPVGNALIG